MPITRKPISQTAYRQAMMERFMLRRRFDNQLTGGGIVNRRTGLGTSLDKSEDSFFYPTRIYSRQPLETLCIESSAAGKFVNFLVDDMFIKWRQFEGEDDSAVEALETAEMELDVQDSLRNAIIAGRQYGSGFAVMITKEAPLEEPLDLNRIREGDFQAIHYFDRYDCSITERDRDLQSRNYGNPTWYHFHPTHGTPFMAHYTRVLRFDGIRPSTKSGFTYYDQDFGISRLIPVIMSILQDASLAQGIAHMSHEASIPILHLAGLRSTGSGALGNEELSVDDLGSQIRRDMSIHRLMMLDEPARESFVREAVQFGGLADLMDRFENRVASAGGYPQTRFNGNAPTGLNATGESDMKNYVIMFEANRVKMLHAPLGKLDEVLSRHVGLKEPPSYNWPSLIDISDQDRMNVVKTITDILHTAFQDGSIDEQEYRDILREHEMFADLPEEAPEPEPLDGIDLDDPFDAQTQNPQNNQNNQNNEDGEDA